jgi:hypothetical protein
MPQCAVGCPSVRADRRPRGGDDLESLVVIHLPLSLPCALAAACIFAAAPESSGEEDRGGQVDPRF